MIQSPWLLIGKLFGYEIITFHYDQRNTPCKLYHLLLSKFKNHFSLGDTPEIVSKIVHVYWDDAEDQVKIDNGTLSTIIRIDKEKEEAAKEKLEAKIKAKTDDGSKANESRQKRSLSSGNIGVPEVTKKVLVGS